ncbi:MAG: hypothetical protein KBA66_08995 [Leptospiraceae bacterium]|nr:hypothetical protein [Leptospiraceae bacterium]
MKNKNFIALCLLALTISIYGNEKSSFAIPLRIEPAAVYTKIRIDGQGVEKREDNIYEREKQGSIEGEFKFFEYFSVKAGTTKTQWEKSDSATLTQQSRLNVGLKFASEHKFSSGAFVWGGGVRGFDKQSPKYAREGVAPELYLIRPNLNLGLKLGDFEAIIDLQMQSETNKAFKENQQEQFRRYYQGGLALSYGLTENFRLFAETECRKPYNSSIDVNSKFWNVYPGFSYQIYKGGFISASLQFPVIEERLMDRGARISYFHVFE